MVILHLFLWLQLPLEGSNIYVYQILDQSSDILSINPNKPPSHATGKKPREKAAHGDHKMMSNGGRCSWWSTATATELGSEAKPHLQSCDESSGSACGSSITFQEVAPHSFIDSSISWTQALLNGERPETFLSMLQDQELGSRACIEKQDSPMVSAMDHNFLFQHYSSSPGDESIHHSSMNPISSYGSWPKPLLSQEVNNQLQFIAGNTSPWCNINTTTGADHGNSIFHPPTLASKTTTCGRKMVSSATHDACSSSSAKKTGGDQKRPRVEAASSSPLPPFKSFNMKVRKEKLGDRVTALQQLVSPFGKTDTASVLQEAIDYIKFLHDQVGVLSSPYFKDGLPSNHKQVPNLMQMINEQQPENRDAAKQLADLRSRGLCLVPISGTYPVAGETAGDFWHPSAALFGGSFR
ncbi:transcription factor bHLH112-like isoform X1 [Zingiber officinale]|uniref:transcription factor bHLH112-like isoform X1 n=1 Tax=Zingiber officinale TaxID=94328 RepID=UPI001C4C8818|nr:transcription factor bHLH112-like isoform X1 [Zingiber officinale]